MSLRELAKAVRRPPLRRDLPLWKTQFQRALTYFDLANEVKGASSSDWKHSKGS